MLANCFCSDQLTSYKLFCCCQCQFDCSFIHLFVHCSVLAYCQKCILPFFFLSLLARALVKLTPSLSLNNSCIRTSILLSFLDNTAKAICIPFLVPMLSQSTLPHRQSCKQGAPAQSTPTTFQYTVSYRQKGKHHFIDSRLIVGHNRDTNIDVHQRHGRLPRIGQSLQRILRLDRECRSSNPTELQICRRKLECNLASRCQRPGRHPVVLRRRDHRRHQRCCSVPDLDLSYALANIASLPRLRQPRHSGVSILRNSELVRQLQAHEPLSFGHEAHTPVALLHPLRSSYESA